ncbi:TetR/AcrR family transcriptional regulator [Curtobacterium sp. A7_M15]|uniref:TetR/AcrR family transcriptional regulator n=1 Tax=Curtobacterium sp. A7_M15 TaxID=3065241 RepID=UPI002737C4FF|nr:TetR/AcrR family transcriptional regulator [Curtobacterium sp. A7_M15]MDP4331907.1 TetR/AcrR family transcriptional regulator [Curtobacterium sp. A7_M15]
MASRRTRARVHEAVLGLVAEVGFAKLTMEGIAARAGVGKQTLYRTWPSTAAIVFDALLARSETVDGVVVVSDSGDLRSDLLVLVQETIRELTSPTSEPLFRAVTAAIQSDVELAREYRERLLEPQVSAVALRLERGGVTDPAGAAELLLGPVLHRWLLRNGAFTDGWTIRHVDRVLLGVQQGHPEGAGRSGRGPHDAR